MFSKSRVNESLKPPETKMGSKGDTSNEGGTEKPSDSSVFKNTPESKMPKAKPAPSMISSDLKIKGNVETTGDIQFEGEIDGDIRAHILTVGEGATIRGEIVADDVVINGRIIGRVRGLKVRLTSTARVEGDVIHKTIAIESGAHFEGSVQRQDDPLGSTKKNISFSDKPAAIEM